jgi:Tfp pilus assembly protein PilE
MTLAEVMVSMAVTSVVMALATAGIVQMYRTSSRTDVLSGEMTQLQTAFQLLDRSVRYATAISQPNTTASSAGDWYVEWTSAAGTTTACTQLRLDAASKQLQRRSETSGGQPGAWIPVASLLTGTQPFTLQPASTSGYPHQRLTVDVTVRPSATSTVTRRSQFSFTALNTTLTTVATGVCSDMSRP